MNYATLRFLRMITLPYSEVPEDGGLVEVGQRDHVLDAILPQVLARLHRAQVVQCERLCDVVDHRLHGDDLSGLVKLQHLSGQHVADTWVEPHQVPGAEVPGTVHHGGVRRKD